MNYEHLQNDFAAAVELLKRQQAEIVRLRAVMDAADAFVTQPPDDMPDEIPFNQYTTAGDCRALNKAYREAAEAKGGMMSGPEDQEPEFDEEAYAVWLEMTNEERLQSGLLTTPVAAEAKGGET